MLSSFPPPDEDENYATTTSNIAVDAITTADAALSFEIGGTAITNGGITVTQSGSAAGDVDTSTPSAANSVEEGDAIEMISDGASATACEAIITFVIRR